jgi:hypothetical protein
MEHAQRDEARAQQWSNGARAQQLEQGSNGAHAQQWSNGVMEHTHSTFQSRLEPGLPAEYHLTLLCTRGQISGTQAQEQLWGGQSSGTTEPFTFSSLDDALMFSSALCFQIYKGGGGGEGFATISRCCWRTTSTRKRNVRLCVQLVRREERTISHDCRQREQD